MTSEPPPQAYPGRELELALDPQRRRERGRHFTLPAVAARMAHYALPRPGGRVLDPACGSGALLEHARARGAQELVGVDVDDDAVRYARGQLGDAAALHRADFLALAPEALGGPFDALVANPPYRRHEGLAPSRKAALRRRLGAQLDGAGVGRIDLFGYFLVHGTAFLRPGGRLALLTPAAWLTSAYGEAIRRFLAAEYTVDQVVESAAEPWFLEARTRPVLVLARRGPPPPDHAVDFVQLQQPLDTLGALPAGTAVSVRELTDGRPWGGFLRTPPELPAIREELGDAWVPLGSLVEPRFGLKTGADRFFVFRDGHNARGDRWRGPAEHLHPLVLSPMELRRLEVDPGALPRSVLVLPPGTPPPPQAAAMIRRAEADGLHRRPTCAARERKDGSRRWYQLEPGPAAPLLWTRTVQYRHLVPANPDGAVVNNNLIPLWPRPGVDPAALLASLNSAWTFLERCARGRVSNEGKVKTEVGDLAPLRVLDPARLDAPPLHHLQGRRIEALDEELAREERRAFELALLHRCGLPPVRAEAWFQRLTRRVTRLLQAERAWEALYRRRRGSHTRPRPASR